jgi:hypothetical protein
MSVKTFTFYMTTFNTADDDAAARILLCDCVVHFAKFLYFAKFFIAALFANSRDQFEGNGGVD